VSVFLELNQNPMRFLICLETDGSNCLGWNGSCHFSFSPEKKKTENSC